MPLGRTPIVGSMTVRDALLNVINEDMAELFSRVETLELGGLFGVAIATEEEAIAGADNTKAMTPLRTHQAIASNPSGYLTASSHTKGLHDSLGIDADTLDGQHASAFLQSASHTKSLHDSLGIDADTLDGQHASAFLQSASHTKALHDSLGIDADTLDGYHSTDFHRTSNDINVPSGKVIDFADSIGDKIRLYDTLYGIAVNPSELTLYKWDSAEIAVRDNAYNGQKVGDVIHTGNMLNKGVAMPLSRLVSTSGGYTVKTFRGNNNIKNYYEPHLTICVPWTGTTTYRLSIYNSGTSSTNISVNLQEITYGPYSISAGGTIDINIDHTGTGDTILWLVGSNTSCYLKSIRVMTGNADILYELTTIWLGGNFAPVD